MGSVGSNNIIWSVLVEQPSEHLESFDCGSLDRQRRTAEPTWPQAVPDLIRSPAHETSAKEPSLGYSRRTALAVALHMGRLPEHTITPVGIVIHHHRLSGQFYCVRTTLNLSSWDEFPQNVFRARSIGTHLSHWLPLRDLPDGTVRLGRPEHCVEHMPKLLIPILGIVLIGYFSSKDNRKGIRLH